LFEKEIVLFFQWVKQPITVL